MTHWMYWSYAVSGAYHLICVARAMRNGAKSLPAVVVSSSGFFLYSGMFICALLVLHHRTAEGATIGFITLMILILTMAVALRIANPGIRSHSRYRVAVCPPRPPLPRDGAGGRFPTLVHVMLQHVLIRMEPAIYRTSIEIISFCRDNRKSPIWLLNINI